MENAQTDFRKLLANFETFAKEGERVQEVVQSSNFVNLLVNFRQSLERQSQEFKQLLEKPEAQKGLAKLRELIEQQSLTFCSPEMKREIERTREVLEQLPSQLAKMARPEYSYKPEGLKKLEPAVQRKKNKIGF